MFPCSNTIPGSIGPFLGKTGNKGLKKRRRGSYVPRVGNIGPGEHRHDPRRYMYSVTPQHCKHDKLSSQSGRKLTAGTIELVHTFTNIRTHKYTYVHIQEHNVHIDKHTNIHTSKHVMELKYNFFSNCRFSLLSSLI